MYQLRVMSGQHEGSCLILDEKPYLIGTKETAGLRLCDQGIAAEHALALLIGSVCLLTAVDGNIGSANAANVSIRLNLGQLVQIGPVWLTLEPLEATLEHKVVAVQLNPSRQHAAKALVQLHANLIWLFALLVLSIVTIAAAYMLRIGPRVPDLEKDVVVKPLVTAVPLASTVKSVVPQQSSVLSQQQLREAFRDRLESAKLLQRFTLDLQDQLWAMKASLDDDELKRFEQVLLIFVREFDIRFPFNAKIASAEDILPFKVQQVIFGDHPCLVTKDGQRLFVGDEYLGFRLTSITSGRLSFAGKRKLVMNW